MFSSRSPATSAPWTDKVLLLLIFIDSPQPSVFAASQDCVKPVFNSKEVNKNKAYPRVSVLTAKCYFGWDRRKRRHENLEIP